MKIFKKNIFNFIKNQGSAIEYLNLTNLIIQKKK